MKYVLLKYFCLGCVIMQVFIAIAYLIIFIKDTSLNEYLIISLYAASLGLYVVDDYKKYKKKCSGNHQHE
jgi:hypothetical protein